ncbi:MAG: hypothetical protein R2726_22320 [Acidimicrobiales bacterium]
MSAPTRPPSRPAPRAASGGGTAARRAARAGQRAGGEAGHAAGSSSPTATTTAATRGGTLDPDALDTVADALEELGATGRLVGVITHVRELAERMPVRFEVAKVGTTSVVSRAEA